MNKKLTLSGVQVSIQPDVIFRRDSRGKKYVGGMKFHVSKSYRLELPGQEVVGAILKDFIEKNVASEDEIVDVGMCFSYDVYNQSLRNAPRSYVRRFKEAEDACKEIEMRWQRL